MSVNEDKNLLWMLYSVYAVLGVCCTWCMLYLVYAVLGVCCTRCMLYSVYAELRVNSWSWHGEIERDDLTLYSAMMLEWWMRKREIGDEMRTMWMIRADMWNHGYELPDWVGKTAYRCNYTPDRNSYLLYWGWYIDLHTKFLAVSVSHHDFPHLLSSLSFLSSTLPSPKNTKLSHRSLSLHAMMKS